MAKSSLKSPSNLKDSNSKKVTALPFEGELFPSFQKRFLETIVIVPFYGAHKKALSRHREFLNELGYDVVLFNLKNTLKDTQGRILSERKTIGFKSIWADQIETILDLIEGPKIIFSFSNPSSGAIEAIARRQAHDIQGLVCDSGPSEKLFSSLLNFYKFERPIGWLPFRLITAASMTWLISPFYRSSIHQDLEKLPEHFQILSIRGWKDPLIPTGDIDGVFEPHHQIDWQRLSLPEATHLNGLRDYRKDYSKPVAHFLERLSTPI